jgi:hypothetical protein
MIKGFGTIAALVGVTALLGSFSSYRFTRAGAWLPAVPNAIDGAWDAVETPVDPGVLSALGNPQALAREYQNPFGDRVFCSLVAAGPFENYHDPTVCVGGAAAAFTNTAKKIVTIDGPGRGEARAMIFQSRRNPNLRIVMYYWQQNRDGSTSTEARMGNYRDIRARLQTGFGAVVRGNQTVLVRIYIPFLESEDPHGLHSQRAVHTISQAIYRSLLESGKGG